MERDNNVGISFWEMTADEVLSKLAIITKNPELLWEGIQKHFAKGFFNGCIEKEFGITPATHDELVERFDEKVKTYQDSAKK